MHYFQTLVDRVSTCVSYVKIILIYLLIAFLTCCALKNHLPILRGLDRFLWKRGADAEERAEQFEWPCPELLLREWGQQELGRRNEEEKRYKADEIGRSAEGLRRRIRSREVEEEKQAKLAECLAKEQELDRLSQRLAQNRDEEQQLQFENEKICRRIARRREEQEELKYEQRRLSHKIETMAHFPEQSQSREEQLQEAVRKEEELQRNKEILARGNERRVALEKQRRAAIEIERSMVAGEERRNVMETEYFSDRDNARFEPSDTELDLELGLDCTTIGIL
ncbi:hypothetical protein MMC29_007292 [Sticta canariensis]|nr:hypothetical protein [Sticta canariensis]